MKWQEGRRNNSYFKKKLIESKWPIPFDIYILKYPKKARIFPHIDPIQEGKRHFRINVVLKKAKDGGRFYYNSYSGTVKSLLNRVYFFRPDITLHGVTEVKEGTRYVLSIGWLL